MWKKVKTLSPQSDISLGKYVARDLMIFPVSKVALKNLCQCFSPSIFFVKFQIWTSPSVPRVQSFLGNFTGFSSWLLCRRFGKLVFLLSLSSIDGENQSLPSIVRDFSFSPKYKLSLLWWLTNYWWCYRKYFIGINRISSKQEL